MNNGDWVTVINNSRLAGITTRITRIHNDPHLLYLWVILNNGWLAPRKQLRPATSVEILTAKLEGKI